MLSGSSFGARPEAGALCAPLSSSLPQATKQQLHAGVNRQGSHAGRSNMPDLTWRSCIQQWQKEAECTAAGIVYSVTTASTDSLNIGYCTGSKSRLLQQNDAAMRQMLRRSPSMVPNARAGEPGTSLGGQEVRYTVACEQTCCMIATSGFPPHLNSALTGLSPRAAHHIILQTWVTSPLSSSQPELLDVLAVLRTKKQHCSEGTCHKLVRPTS